jgi:hypothetical protein
MRKIVLIPLLAVTLTSWAAQADDRGRDGRRPIWRHDQRRPEGYFTRHYVPHGRVIRTLPGGFLRLFVGGLEFFYWEGMYYRQEEDRYIVVPAPVGAVVTTIPSPVQPVIVEGVPYYVINGVTYMHTTSGYQVVPPPTTIVVRQEPDQQTVLPTLTDQNVTAIPAAPAPNSTNNEDAFTVNIPNLKGTYTAVTLKRSGHGFVGPQGEYYSEFPSIDQLKVMYGKL